MDLDCLTDAELVTLGCTLNGGTFGKDPARMNKASKMAYIRDLAAADVVEATAANVLAARPAGYKAPARAVEAVEAAAVVPPVGAARAEAAVTGDAAAQLEAAIRAIAAATAGRGAGTVDPEAIRAAVEADVTALRAQVAALEEKYEAAAALGNRALADMAAAVEAMGGAQPQAPRALDLSGVGGAPEVSLEGTHPDFELVLRLCSLPKALRPNVLLVGPAGCGKSTLAGQIAAALERPFYTCSLSAGATEAMLTVRVLPIHEGGRFGAVDSEFLRHYSKPSVILLDEMDGADPNMLLVANAALANGGMHVEARAVDGQETYVRRDEHAVILAAANTFGTGATAQYVGRGALDAATLDRYVIVTMDYDAALEAKITGAAVPEVTRWTPSASTEPEAVRADLATLGTWLTDLRGKVAAAGLQRVVSTRAFQKAVALRAVGCSVAETKARLLAGWRDDEKAAVGFEEEPWALTASALTAHEQHAPGVSCPECGGRMVRRMAQRGHNAGRYFLGCADYPNCKGTRAEAEAA